LSYNVIKKVVSQPNFVVTDVVVEFGIHDGNQMKLRIELLASGGASAYKLQTQTGSEGTWTDVKTAAAAILLFNGYVADAALAPLGSNCRIVATGNITACTGVLVLQEF